MGVMLDVVHVAEAAQRRGVERVACELGGSRRRRVRLALTGLEVSMLNGMANSVVDRRPDDKAASDGL